MTGELPSTPLEYLHPSTTPVPGPIARKMLAAWPWWIWPALAVPGLVPAVLMYGGPLDPDTLYLWPLMGVVGYVCSALPLLAVAGIRAVVRLGLARRFRMAPGGLVWESRPIGITVGLLAAYWLIAGTPLAMNLSAAARSSAFESIRTRVAAGEMPAGPVTVLPFRLTDTELNTGEGNGIVILYTDGTRGTFPGSGSGFLYVPEGESIPGYNRGSDGRLFGRWYWFTTD